MSAVHSKICEEPMTSDEDRRTDEKCAVCGAWIRAQGEYRYCPMQGMVGHIIKAREMKDR